MIIYPHQRSPRLLSCVHFLKTILNNKEINVSDNADCLARLCFTCSAFSSILSLANDFPPDKPEGAGMLR